LQNKSIAQIDLKGWLIGEVLPQDWYKGSGEAYGETLSVSGEWLAYTVGQGEQGYDSWEFQDIETLRLVDLEIFHLTDRGGAFQAEWSPDGMLVAFSDFDENGVNQIYIAKADGTDKIELTSFREKDFRVLMLRWSPDGKKLAFQHNNNQIRSISLGVIYMDTDERVVRTFPEMQASAKNFWWDNNETLVIHVRPDENVDSQGETGILWLNIYTGQIINSLWESETLEQHIVAAGYLEQSIIYFFSDSALFTYDARTDIIQWQFDRLFSFSELDLAPVGFPGEANCINP